MRRFFEIVLGVPLSAEDLDTAFRSFTGGTPQQAGDALRWGAGHNTEKSGALLGAQAIFLVVDTFALDHGWPRGLTLASLFLLVTPALILMTNLRSTVRVWQHESVEASHRHIFNATVARSLRFNLALYMTFLSIILLAAAALSFAF